jgi:O-antigen ligase
LKWAGLIILLVVTIPLMMWVRCNPRIVPKIMLLVGFLPFGTAPFHLYMAAISWPAWPGYVKGIEYSVLDSLALALYLGLPRVRDALPFRPAMALYLVAVLFSVVHAAVPMAAVFYAWQLARMFLIFAAVSKATVEPRASLALLSGMAAGLCMEAGAAAWDRFALGILQAAGTASHQNLLGLMSHFVVFPFFALLLAGRRGWLPTVAMLAGITVEALTTSRATVGLAAAGFAALFVLSTLRQWTTRKALVLLAVAGLLAAAALAILSSFDQRFAAQNQSNYDERAAFVSAASAMLSDHPLGIGANNYVLTANMEGYNAKAGVAPTSTSSGANVHNVYLLVAAETGYVGLTAYLLVLLSPLGMAFGCGWRSRDDQRGDLLLGIGMALLTVYIHSFFEWIFITFEPQYMFAVELGLMVGVARQLGWRRPSATYVQARPSTIRRARNAL